MYVCVCVCARERASVCMCVRVCASPPLDLRFLFQKKSNFFSSFFLYIIFFFCHAGDGLYEFCPGNGTRETSLGMEAVFQRLLRDSVPPESLRLNKAVKAIRWTSGGDPVFETVRSVSSMDDVEAFTKGENRTKYGANNNLIGRRNLEEETARFIGLNTKNSDRTTSFIERMQNHINRQESTKRIDYDEEEDNLNPDEEGSTVWSTLKSDLDEIVKPDFDVRIECEDGDVFYADHVIVTSSIGFLRSNPDFFQPPLTPQHRAAIGSMGFGNVSKMFLLWETEEGTAGQSSAPCGDAAGDWQRRVFGSDVEGMIPLWLDGVQAEVKAATSSLRTSVRA